MAEKRTYEAIRTELDQVMGRFESSTHTDVDDMLKDYDRATVLVKELESYLSKAEVSLKKLKAK
jgi:exonuclease VII small subunit